LVVNQKDHKNGRIQLQLAVIYRSKIAKSDSNAVPMCVAIMKACKVQTVNLTLCRQY